MFKSQMFASALALASASLLLAGCMGPKRSVGIQKVDSLVGRVERVHFDAERGIQTAGAAVDALRVIVRRDFEGPAVDAYEAFVEALEKSEAQAARLRGDVLPMDDAAAEVWRRWSEDLAAFSGASMRRRSQERRDESARVYAELVETLGPSIAGLEGFNSLLRDHALFLSNDLNTSSIEILEPELELLRGNLVLLEDVLRTTMDAASAYVRKAAPLGQVDVVADRSEEDEAPESEGR